MKFCNINGKTLPVSEAIIPVDNGAFRYGYGLFETMLVADGEIRLTRFHWERLLAGARQLYFEMPTLMTAEWLEAEVLRTVKKNHAEQLCRVRLQLYAGGGGLYSSESRQPGFIIECFPLEADNMGLNDNGIVAGIADGVRKSVDVLSNLKCCNALIYAVAARQAKAQRWNDALICNTDDNIIESTIANIFWIKDDVVYTPPLADGCVAGVMRRHITEKIPVVEKSLNRKELLIADEVFLSNAIKKIRWVGAIGDKTYGNQKIKEIYGYL